MILKREMLYESYSFESILTKLILLFMWGFSKSMFYFTIKSNYITKKIKADCFCFQENKFLL